MKKHLATALTAGICLVTGCMDKGPEPKPMPATTQPVAVVTPGNATPTAPSLVTPATQPATGSPTANSGAPWDDMVSGKPVFFRVRAEGVQIYEAKEKDGKLAWTFKAPEALLYDAKGKAIGKHVMTPAGATWELNDGSKIVGEKKGMLEKPGTIPWLTIAVKSHEGPPKGKLAMVGYVQRVDTDGGVMPAVAPMAAQAGKEERVPYRATYVFYAGK